jgi:hypothetical protein
VAKTRQELNGRVAVTLIFTLPPFYGALTLWLWLVPLRPAFEPSTGTAAVLATFATLLTAAVTLCLPIGVAVNGSPTRDEPPRSALRHCTPMVWDVLWPVGMIAAVPSVLGAIVLGIIAAVN